VISPEVALILFKYPFPYKKGSFVFKYVSDLALLTLSSTWDFSVATPEINNDPSTLNCGKRKKNASFSFGALDEEEKEKEKESHSPAAKKEDDQLVVYDPGYAQRVLRTLETIPESGNSVIRRISKIKANYSSKRLATGRPIDPTYLAALNVLLDFHVVYTPFKTNTLIENCIPILNRHQQVKCLSYQWIARVTFPVIK
jgi:hypothetical protein